jgi:hypothetical protein
MRQLATISDYDGLIRALRARVDELDISRETIDLVSGLQSGYAAKLLAQIKGVGRISLGPLLGTLGCVLVLVEDEAALDLVRSRLVKRCAAPSARANAVRWRRRETPASSGNGPSQDTGPDPR